MRKYLASVLLLLIGATGIVTIKLKNTSTAKAYLNVLEIREKL